MRASPPTHDPVLADEAAAKHQDRQGDERQAVQREVRDAGDTVEQRGGHHERYKEPKELPLHAASVAMVSIVGVSPRHRLWLVALVAGLVVLGASFPATVELIAFAGPLVVLAACLCIRWYPGEQKLVRRIGRRMAPSAASTSGDRPRTPLRAAPRGGLLIAFSLAVRPPPANAR